MAGNNLVEFLNEVLQPLGAVRSKKMFGGAMVYIDGVAVALLDGDAVYFKADDTTKTMFEAEGQGPFIYEGKTRPVAMSYWRVPERLYDEPDEMVEWARAALKVAHAIAATKSKYKTARKAAPIKTPASKKPASTIPASKKSRKKT